MMKPPLTEQETAMVVEKSQRIEGTEPPTAPIPAPGIYWLRTTSIGFSHWFDRTGTRLEHPEHGNIWSVYTWEGSKPSEWFLADVEQDGEYITIGSDCECSWVTRSGKVTHVGPRVTPPEE